MGRDAVHRAQRPAGTAEAGRFAVSYGTAELVADPDRPRAFTLLLDGVPSSYVDLDDPEFLPFEYVDWFARMTAARFSPGPLRVLHLGAAGCSFARYLDAVRPGSRQLAVDVDAGLAGRVRDWFELPRSPALRIRVDDAAHAVATLGGRFDLVVRDVFAGGVVPGPCADRTFFGHCRALLRPGGLLLANTGYRRGETGGAEVAAASAAFGGEVAAVTEPAVWRGRRHGNLVLAAGVGLPLDDWRRALLGGPAPAQVVAGAELVSRLAGR